MFDKNVLGKTYVLVIHPKNHKPLLRVKSLNLLNTASSGSRRFEYKGAFKNILNFYVQWTRVRVKMTRLSISFFFFFADISRFSCRRSQCIFVFWPRYKSFAGKHRKSQKSLLQSSWRKKAGQMWRELFRWYRSTYSGFYCYC